MVGLSIYASPILSAVIYTRYHLVMFTICAFVVWCMPQTWTYTQRITPGKAVVCATAFLASVALMWTQTVNPFLYYQF
jgi:alginate O-acetyltransferase complex protein AlgI